MPPPATALQQAILLQFFAKRAPAAAPAAAAAPTAPPAADPAPAAEAAAPAAAAEQNIAKPSVALLPPRDDRAQNAAPNGGITAYEQARMERIARNREVMRSMGLGAGGAAALPGASPPPPLKPQRAAKRAPPAPAAPVRRSARGRGAGAGAVPGARPPPPCAPSPPPSFDDSAVRRYVVAAAAAADGGARRRAASPPPGARLAGFARLPGELAAPALARAYAAHYGANGLAAAGGKGGVVAVWGAAALAAGARGAGAALPPLLSAKLHAGWVADVQLLDGVPGADDAEKILLLTAGNDGALSVWDVGRASATGRAAPERLAHSENAHGGAGVFSAHWSADAGGGAVASAGKDGAAVLSLVREGGAELEAVARWEDLHGGGVAKCARWRPGDRDVFATCGNDGKVLVVDARAGARGAAALEAGRHASAASCVRWSPAAGVHVLLSASADPCMLLHDARRPGAPLAALRGHVAGARAKGMYQPAFFDAGAGVAAAAEGAAPPLVCLWDVASAGAGAAADEDAAGLPASRGALDAAVGATFCAGAARGDPLLVTFARGAALLAPAWA
jgi:hypothetical protein